jgi:hypothetical protein
MHAPAIWNLSIHREPGLACRRITDLLVAFPGALAAWKETSKGKRAGIRSLLILKTKPRGHPDGG